MAGDDDPDDPSMEVTSFEAEIRQQRELMKEMATRESWDAESQWVIQGRRLATGALLAAAIFGFVLILWIASSLFLGT